MPAAYREIKRYLAEYDSHSGERRAVQREPGHAYSKSEFFRRELPAEAIAQLLAHFANRRRQREARVLDFTPWAGAYNRVPAHATAFAHRTERLLLKHEVVVDAGATDAERTPRVAGSRARRRSSTHAARVACTPTSPTQSSRTGRVPTTALTSTRLQQVKATYDPDNVFRFDQSVQPRLASDAPW